MTYVDDNGVVVVRTATGSVDIYTDEHEQALHPAHEDVPIIIRGLLLHLQAQVESIDPPTDEAYDTYDAIDFVLRYLENHK